MIIEIIGIVATLFILASMCFKTTYKRGNIIMRVLNLIGSIIFTIYGILLPAFSTAILNACLFAVNLIHLIILIKQN